MEYNFRAWNKLKAIMVYNNEDNSRYSLCSEYLNDIEMINTKLQNVKQHYNYMLRTSTKDSNGIFIYDKDILKAEVLNNFDEHESYVYFKVDDVADAFRCFFLYSDIGTSYNFLQNSELPETLHSLFSDRVTFATVEVVGNSYENREYIKRATKEAKNILLKWGSKQ